MSNYLGDYDKEVSQVRIGSKVRYFGLVWQEGTLVSVSPNKKSCFVRFGERVYEVPFDEVIPVNQSKTIK